MKIGKYIGFCVYRRSYLLWSPVIIVCDPGSDLYDYNIDKKEREKEGEKNKWDTGGGVLDRRGVTRFHAWP